MSRTSLCALCIAHIILLSVDLSSAADHPKASSTVIGQSAVDAGYSKVPIRYGCGGQKMWVLLTVGDEKLKMFLDTGAGPTILTTQAAKRLKLKLEKPPADSAVVGVLGAHEVQFALLEGAKIDTLEVPASKVAVGDIAAMLKDADSGATDGDGVFGTDFFRFYSAVIDCDAPALYIISPAKKLWPKLQGIWVLEACETDGVSVTADGRPSPELEFGTKVGQVRFRTDSGKSEAVLADAELLKFGSWHVVVVNPQKGESASPLFIRLGLLKVEGDTLRICSAMKLKGDESDWANLPKAFEAKKGSGHVLYTFKRVKAEKK